MSEHTPRPWAYDALAHVVTAPVAVADDPEGRTVPVVVAYVEGPDLSAAVADRDQQRANGFVIAAAPALLAYALAERAADEHYDRCEVCRPGICCSGYHRLHGVAVNLRIDAIAKARP